MNHGVIMRYAVSQMLLMTIIIAIPLPGTTTVRDYTIIVEPRWLDLERNNQNTELFGGKWILAGSITFRKKSKETIYLSKLTFRWKGNKLENLLGSLYKKDLDKQFLPVEEFLISDSNWNKKKQTLIFNFNKSISLGPTNIFYLVLTVPEPIENAIKQGFFVVESNSLPIPYKSIARYTSPSLAFNNTPSPEKSATHTKETVLA